MEKKERNGGAHICRGMEGLQKWKGGRGNLEGYAKWRLV
jgi:hypothetical protein